MHLPDIGNDVTDRNSTIAMLATLVAVVTLPHQATGADDGDAAAPLRLSAVVVKYQPNAMHDLLADGFASYDATRLQIFAPKKHLGRQSIFHNTPQKPSSPWRIPGAWIDFSIDPQNLKADQIFAGAAENLKLVAILSREQIAGGLPDFSKLVRPNGTSVRMAATVFEQAEPLRVSIGRGLVSYEATRLRVSEPAEHAGEIVFCHAEPLDADSVWRSAGAQLRFNIRISLLKQNQWHLFTGAIQNLEVISKPSRIE